MIRPLSLAISVLFVCAGPVWADALDGDWCNPTDGKLTIDGPTIITPAGQSVKGNYGRHRFTYTAPAGDWQAGQDIVIQQYNEQLMELKIGDQQGRKWRPCQVVS
ncbi:MAG: hypothetical protein ABJM29_20635 [Rhizobiaceae bacterium]